MTDRPPATRQLFVVDCYDASGRGLAFPLPPAPHGAHLACAVRVPSDDLVQAFVEGTDESAVTASLTAAGWHVDRITAATWAHPPAAGCTCTTGVTGVTGVTGAPAVAAP